MVEARGGVWHIRIVVSAIFFVFGLVVGSFLNVCILRIPEDESIITPRSHCPKCGTPIRPYDNIPVLSWLLLRGKCRACGKGISAMYPAIELLTGLLFVACFEVFGMTIPTFKWMLFSCLMIVLTVTDYRTRLLPDAVTWPGFGMGLVFSAVAPPSSIASLSGTSSFTYLTGTRDGVAQWLVTRVWPGGVNPAVTGVLDALLGAAFGGLLLWGAGALYKLVRKREGMGLGDVKMMALVGAFVGLRKTFLTILLGTLLGSVIGIVVVAALYVGGWKWQVAERASRQGLGTVASLRWTLASQYQLPLGTFLGVAALLVVFLTQPTVLNRIAAAP